MTTLDDVRAELLAYEQSKPRSVQVQTGASGIYGCRAQTLLRLTGTPQTDPRLSWEAVVGTGIHRAFEDAAGDGVLTEYRVEYRGVPCTIDRYDPRTRTLCDFKSKADGGAIAAARRAGPTRDQEAQLHIGAAALIEAGHPVDTVEFLYVPRSGTLADAWLWSAPFDREQADAAAEWSAEQDARADADVGDGTSYLDGLRDKPERFCRSYCEWVSLCRGPETPLPDFDDPFLAERAEAYADGRAMEAEGAALMRDARADLLGVRGTCGGWKVLTSGGNVKTVEEVDMDGVLAGYREWFGELPMRTVEKTTAVSLRVTPAKSVT